MAESLSFDLKSVALLESPLPLAQAVSVRLLSGRADPQSKLRFGGIGLGPGLARSVGRFGQKRRTQRWKCGSYAQASGQAPEL